MVFRKGLISNTVKGQLNYLKHLTHISYYILILGTHALLLSVCPKDPPLPALLALTPLCYNCCLHWFTVVVHLCV